MNTLTTDCAILQRDSVPEMAGTQGVSNRFTFACLPRTERGQPIVMDKDPKGETFLYCHGNSVIIRNLSSPQISDIYTQHSCQVSSAPAFRHQ